MLIVIKNDKMKFQVQKSTLQFNAQRCLCTFASSQMKSIRITENLFFKVCFQMRIAFQVGTECKQTSSESKNISFLLIASVCTASFLFFPFSSLIYLGLQMEPIRASCAWFHLPQHTRFYWAIKQMDLS